MPVQQPHEIQDKFEDGMGVLLGLVKTLGIDDWSFFGGTEA
eukprot:CAMPEP_0174947234 /NCGR_PEP_ID=MMETSP1355-20121228/86147_1 /TAXON_ID=464990 /ORGANISM="Hemiselmis tepida, Strain CCMP443" /LENGTH=40 /DNA_ID= /DNA_START= /DNA_END= /DNA_ORIENTATION=